MYFPILRGRQYELIALRELVENKELSKKIIPIVEPVRLSSTLLSTIDAFNNAKSDIGVVLNPQVGNFLEEIRNSKDSYRERFFEQLKSDKVIQTVYLNEQCLETIQWYGDKVSITNPIMICGNLDAIPIYDEMIKNYLPKYALIPDESAYRRRVRNHRVLLADRFNKLDRNVDYAKQDDEPFSEDHLYFKEDGYEGFSDYSIIGNEYYEKGFAPYAVTIHIVYFSKNFTVDGDEFNSLRIKHFVSDTNDDIQDPAAKFEEALRKLVEWYQTSGCLITDAIKTFCKLYEDKSYPGLGTVKKLSIMHHLQLMSMYLDEEQCV